MAGLKSYWMVLIACIFLSSCAVPRKSEPVTQIEAKIKKLGADNQGDIEIIKSLATNRQLAIKLLLRELHVIPEEKLLPSEFAKHQNSMHVIWCLRAMRYLTGKKFLSRTTTPLKKGTLRQQFLYVKDSKKIPFFSTWMSRDIIYVAPKDAQTTIIKNWNNYITSLNNQSKFEQIELNDWYF